MNSKLAAFLPHVLLSCALLVFLGCEKRSHAPTELPGPFPAETNRWDEAEKQRQRAAGETLIQTIETAIKNGDTHLAIPKDDYRFAQTRKVPWGGPAHLPIINPQNLTIDFQGSTLWFENGATGLAMFRARNLVLKNAFLDWDPLPFFQGTVVAIDQAAGTFDFRPDPGYEREHTSTGLRDKEGSADWRGVVFDRNTREIKPGMGGFSVGFFWKNKLPNGDYRVQFRGYFGVPVSKTSLAVGDPMVILARIDRALRLDGAVDTTLEDITLYASPFVCVDQKTGANTTFRRVNIVRRPGTNRLLAGNADGINCGNMIKGPLIEDCRIEMVGDDFVNIHGHFARALHQENPTTLLVSQMNNQFDIPAERFPLTVEFFDRASMKPLGIRKVLSAKLTRWTPTRETTIADLSHKWNSGQAASLAYDRAAPVHQLTLDEPVDFAVGSDVIVACEAFSTPDTVIRNNHFTGSLARGLLLHSPRVVVEGNTIHNVCSSGIVLTSEGSFWGEGAYVHTATIRDNTLTDTGISLGGGDGIRVIQPNPDKYKIQHDIRLEQNFIEKIGGSGISAMGVRDLDVSGNIIKSYGAYARGSGPDGAEEAGAGYAISLRSIENLQLRDNKISQPGPWARGEIWEPDTTKKDAL